MTAGVMPKPNGASRIPSSANEGMVRPTAENPLAAAVGHAVVGLLETGEYQERAAKLGVQLRDRLEGLVGHGVQAVRSRGLWAGVDIDPDLMTGRAACEGLAGRGVLVKDTHGSTIRLAPPLVIEPEDFDRAVDALAAVLAGRGS